MSSSEIDVARSTKRAWKQFREVLADRIAHLEQDATIRIDVETPRTEPAGAGCAPFVQVARCGALLVAELSCNTCLLGSYRLDKAARRRICEIGWSRPIDGPLDNYQFWCEPKCADQVADLATRALRDVFAVVHPAFLVSDLELDEDPLLPSVDEPAAEEPLAIRVYDEGQLNGLIDGAVGLMLGYPPTRDDENDIPIATDSAVVFVRLLPGEPTIRLFSEVAVKVTDLDSAQFEVGVLNRDNTGVRFVLAGDRVVADVTLPAQPFVPDHLRTAIARMCEFVSGVDKDLAHRIGGQTFRGAADASPQVPSAVRALLDLEREHPGLLTPKLVVRACENDPDVILAVVESSEPAPRRTQKVLRKALKIALD